jgi:hypothetical protein
MIGKVKRAERLDVEDMTSAFASIFDYFINRREKKTERGEKLVELRCLLNCSENPFSSYVL